MLSLRHRAGRFSARAAGRTALAAGGFFAVAVTAHAQTFSSPTFQQTIPDNSATGATSAITVAATAPISAFTSLTITGLVHSNIGDLVASLTHTGTNTPTTVDVFDHIGTSSTSNANYNYGTGSAAAFSGNYTFALSGTSLTAVKDGTTVPTGPTYQAAGNATGGFDAANAANTFSSFVGQSEAGTWTLTIRDRQLDDVGSFTGFSFTVASAPEPSECLGVAVGMLGVAGLTLCARRRRTA